MADIFDTLDIRPETKKRDIFDQITPVRVPDVKLEAFRGAGATGGWTEEGLAMRGLKQFANVLPETAKETIYGLGGGKIMSWAGAKMISRRLKKQGINPPSLRDIQKRIKQGILKGTKIPELEITPPATTGEKAVDIVTGVGKFGLKLFLLKKAYPTAPAGALWEMENLSSGGTPGLGYAMHGAFSTPGKLIKGKALLARGGRLAAESAALASVSALEQKIDTGEIDPVQIGIAAALPVALRTPKVIKGLIRKRSPKIVKAIATARVRKYTPEEAKHYKVLSEGIKDDRIVNLLLTKYPKLFDIPTEIKFSTSKPLSGWFSHKTNTVYVNPNYNLTPDKMARTLIHEVIHAHQLRRGKLFSLWKDIRKKYNLKGKSAKQVNDFVRKLGRENLGEYKKLPAEEMAYRAEALIFQKIKSLKPVTIETSNKAIIAWSDKAKLLNATERKASVSRLRKQQAGRGRERYKLEREAGTPRLEAFRRARKAYGGRAAVPEIEPLKLTAAQRDLYGRKIEQIYPVEQQFQRTGAAEAILKMENGRIPTNYEFGLLEPIFGREATKKLYTDLIKKRPFSGWELPALVIQAFKTKFGFDIQMFRQGRSLAVRHPALYLKSSWINARAYVSNKYAEKMFAQVKNSAGYMESEKLGWNYVGEAGYSSKRLEYYSLGLTERLLTSKYKPMRAWGKLLEASERGAVSGINNMQKGLYDIAAKNVQRLNFTPAQRKLWMKNRAKTHNTFIKILRVPPGKQYQGLRKLKQVANYLLFSPSMTVSRPLSIKALVANKGSRKYTAGVIASNIASIYAITAIPTIIGHQMRLQNPEEEPDINGELNVLDGSWGKIRHGDTVFDFSGGDAPFYRTVARIGVSAYMSGREFATGEATTEAFGKRIPNAGETLERYFTTRETAVLGYAKTMLTGKDWLGEPIPRFEATVRALSPELIEATIETGMTDGLWRSLATFAATTTSVGVSTYPARATGTRSKFRDIVSQAKHSVDWDELSMSQQNRLRSEHRKQFEVLSERVRKERIGKPISIEKIKEEELRAGKRIGDMLSEPNRQWVEDISLGLSRRPKNWYLNDKRYNRYQELVAESIDERLSKIDFTGVEEKRRIARVQLIVKLAKNKALGTLRRETRGR